jgi:hypothetical protein
VTSSLFCEKFPVAISGETLNEKTLLVSPIDHGGSCLDHGALGKNALILAHLVRHFPAEL